MFSVILFIFLGISSGYLLRKKRSRSCAKVQTVRDKVITVLIWLLLFLLGVEVGGNEQIIKGLHTIGLEAVILTLGGTLGSVIAAWALWRALYKRKGGRA